MKSTIFCLLAASLVTLLSSCSSPKYLTAPSEFREAVHGAHFVYSYERGRRVVAELIEVTDSSMLMLVASNRFQDSLWQVSRGEIEELSLKIASTSDNPRLVRGLAIANIVGSVFHGFLLPITGTINLVVGASLSTDAADGAYEVNYPEECNWEDLKKFARFPAGIPELVDRSSLYSILTDTSD